MRATSFVMVGILGTVGCQSEKGVTPADPMASIVADHLSGVAAVAAAPRGLDFHLTELPAVALVGQLDATSCGAITGPLWDACGELYQRGMAPLGCDVLASFFFANDTPRCGVRVSVYRDQGLFSVVAFDVSGEPIAGYGERCGNGAIDEGETCDDGNHEDWDGCDPSCQIIQFSGCEQVIQNRFWLSDVAEVPADAWDAPRTQMMVHRGAQALRKLDAALCDSARAAAYATCAELAETMPFVAGCEPVVEYGADDEGSLCSVRLQVWFSRVEQANAVFTTALPGVLQFTIR
jgi:cysteine-rich repeat protein